MIYIYVILYLISSLLMLYNINIISHLVINSMAKFKFSIYAGLYAICSVVYIFLKISYNYPIIDYILLFINYILLFFCVHKNNLLCNTINLIYIVILYLSLDSVLDSMLKLLFSIFYENYNEQIVKLIIQIINRIIIFILISMIKYKKHNRNFQTNSIPRYVYILILYALFCIGGLIENQITITNMKAQMFLNKFFTIISIVLLIFIIISLLLNCISKSCLENTSLLLEKLNYEQAEHYQNIIKLNEDQRKFKHDYQNHLICMYALVKEKQYNDVEQYLQEITHKEIIESNKFFTGNQIADAILSDKAANAAKINAEIKFDGSICDKIPMSDVCVILANALDNAIEACEKITTSSPKIIEVNCVFSQNVQIIQVVNPVEEDIQIYHNSIESTKNDKSSHGIGLYNIMRTVDKYSGEFNISCENKQFILDIGFQVCNADDKQPILD